MSIQIKVIVDWHILYISKYALLYYLVVFVSKYRCKLLSHIFTLHIAFALLKTSFNSNYRIEKCSKKLTKEVAVSAKTFLNE